MGISIERFDPVKNYDGMKSAGKPGGFNCGLPAINKFVAASLAKQVKAQSSVAWVVVYDSKFDPITQKLTQQPFFAGFYTLMMSSVDQNLIVGLGSSLPRQVPCTRLVMLGVDVGYQGQGLGRQLMRHALEQTAIAAALAGCRGMYLDADPGALNFYLGLGFQQLSATASNGSFPMFIFRESFRP